MATSQAQLNPSTALQVNGEAGADIAWSVEGLTNGNGRVAAQHDLGSGARNFQFAWTAEVQWQATPTQYGSLDFYVAGAPDDTAADVDGDVGTSDAALGDADQLRNLVYIGSVVAEEADTTVMRASGMFTHYTRYLSLVCYNDGGATINATDSNFTFKLIPFNIQGQAT